MSEPFIGEIRPWAITFVPRGWMACAGQILPIAQYTTLFSILGTIYGGNGTSTFALPNLAGRVPMGMGNGPGLTPRSEGEMVGEAAVTLTQAQMPQHNHQAMTKFETSTPDGMSSTPMAGYYLARLLAGGNAPGWTWNNGNMPDTTLSPETLSATGGGQAHQNCQPYLAIDWFIAHEGIYPSRN